MFPIVVHITNSYASTSRLDGTDGDIHLGLSDIHMLRNGSWDLWHPDFSLTLNIENESYIVAPCPNNGIQLVGKNNSHEGCIMDMKE